MTARTQSSAVPFTRRERDILRLMALDLTNAEIAERLVVSPQTVKWYIKELYSKLGVHSRDEALALLESLESATEPAAAPTTSHNLPAPVTSFVGRSREIAALRALLRDPAIRLVTLIGTPGIGKTRLSVETAHRLLSDFPDGVFFVPLAPITDPALVGDAVLSALGLDPGGAAPAAERLKVFLRRKRLLLVLDNCEHLLPAAPLVGDLLAEAPGLKVLATSREPLRVYGEREYAVPPLDPASEAVALFEARAQAVRPDFAVNEHNAVTVTAICKRLDGLPLAVELAAARIKLYTPHALLDRLSSRLNTLTGGARDLPARQQTLRSAIAWSYDLLSDDEKRLFARFAVFEGGADLEAFAEICGFGLALAPFDGLESLVSKSLIQQTTGDDGEPRFTMYEALREFAAEQLAASGEEEAIQIAHARVYLKLAEWIGIHVRSADDLIAARKFGADFPNLRRAWLLAAEQSDDALIELAAYTFFRAFYSFGSMNDGLALYEAALALRCDQATLAAADLRIGLANMRGLSADHFGDTVEEEARRVLEIYGRLGRPDRQPEALMVLVLAHADRNEWSVVEKLLTEMRTLGQTHKRHFFVDWADYYSAFFMYMRGEREAAQAALERITQETQLRKSYTWSAWAYANLAAFALSQGDLSTAREWSQQGFDAASLSGYMRLQSSTISALSLIAFVEGDLEASQRLENRAHELALSAGLAAEIGVSNANLAAIAAAQGKLELARPYLTEALALTTHSQLLRYQVLSAVPLVAAHAARLVEAVEFAAFLLSHAAEADIIRIRLASLLDELQAELTPDAYADAWARGEAMTVEEALALARQLAEG